MLYVGDFDPSGMFMSEEDLPERLRQIRRRPHQDQAHCADAASNCAGCRRSRQPIRRKDPRYKWFVANYGDRCWELDAMDPNDLRDCVEQEIMELIEPVAWQRCEVVNKAEQESLRTILAKWPH